MPRRGATLQTTLRIYLTPKDLREIADEMEKRWATANEKKDYFVRPWEGQGVDVAFHLDAYRMEGLHGQPGAGPQQHGISEGVKAALADAATGNADALLAKPKAAHDGPPEGIDPGSLTPPVPTGKPKKVKHALPAT